MNRFKIGQKFRPCWFDYGNQFGFEGYFVAEIHGPDDKERCNYTMYPFIGEWPLIICCICPTYEEIEEMEKL